VPNGLRLPDLLGPVSDDEESVDVSPTLSSVVVIIPEPLPRSILFRFHAGIGGAIKLFLGALTGAAEFGAIEPVGLVAVIPMLKAAPPFLAVLALVLGLSSSSLELTSSHSSAASVGNDDASITLPFSLGLLNEGASGATDLSSMVPSPASSFHLNAFCGVRPLTWPTLCCRFAPLDRGEGGGRELRLGEPGMAARTLLAAGFAWKAASDVRALSGWAVALTGAPRLNRGGGTPREKELDEAAEGSDGGDALDRGRGGRS
jgi:hypothetical protein